MHAYLKIISELPLPTLEQTRAFVDHVAKAHSWYKHLPVFPPGRVLVFYLDPHSGRSILETGGLNELLADFGNSKVIARFRTVILDITDQEQCWHYSQMLTSEYRQKFGYWQYFFVKRSEPEIYSIETVPVEPASPLQVPILIEVPDEIVQQCSCRVTAFISGLAKYKGTVADLNSHLQRLHDYAASNSDNPQIQRYIQLNNTLLEVNKQSSQADAGCWATMDGTEATISVDDPASHAPYCTYPIGTFISEEHAFQREIMLKTLLRSREVFAKYCRVTA